MKKVKITKLLIVLFFTIIFLTFLSLQPFTQKSSSVKTKPQNIIFISIDTLRTDHTNIYGYNKNTTPFLDDFAKNSTVYTNAYTIFPLTPHSLYTFFSGNDDVFTNKKFWYSHWSLEDTPHQKLKMLDILEKEGYKTAAFVTNMVLGNKWFDIFEKSFQEYSYFDATNEIDKVANYPHISKKYFNQVYEPFLYESENAQTLTSKAIKWLQTNKDNQFALWLHYTTPHWPYTPKDDYICTLDKKCQLKEYHSMISSYWSFETNLNEQFNKNSFQNIEEKDLDLIYNLYDAEIRSVDDQIKNIITELDSLNLKQKSLIVIFSDHGESFDHGMYLDHGWVLYNSNIKLFLIVHDPQQNQQNSIDNQLIDNTDMLPYILDVLDIDYQSDSLTGISPLKTNRNKVIYSLTNVDKSNKFSVIEGDYKYIFSNSDKHLYKGYKDELYNLKNDPEELKNIFWLEQEKATHLKKLLFDKIQQSSSENDTEPKLNQDIIEKLKSIGY